MEKIQTLLRDIFAMRFDIIIPLSGCIVAALVAALLFSIRYFTFRRNRRRYEKRLLNEARALEKAGAVPARTEDSEGRIS